MPILYNVEDTCLSHTVLNEALVEYRRPNDKISYMIAKGELTPLARGHYALTNSNNAYLNYNIANSIYGPSYISRYTALSYYGLIADAVYSYESMTLKRSNEFVNDKGRFVFTTSNEDTFAIGLRSINANEVCTFIMATPEKALCDLIWHTENLPIRNRKDMVYFLEEDIRLDMGFFENCNKTIFEECLQNGKKRNLIKYLIKLCK